MKKLICLLLTTTLSIFPSTILTGQSLGTLRNNTSFFVGLQINVGASNLYVTQLGRWCVSGNSGTHIVKLTRVSSGVDVLNGSVSINMSGCTSGTYVYGNLSQTITLSASTNYYLTSQESNGGDQFYDTDTTITMTSDATNTNGSVYFDGSTWQSGGVANHSYGPLNMTYTLTPPATTLPGGRPIMISLLTHK